MKKIATGLLTAALALISGTRLGLAEDVKGKFYVGGNLAALITTDNIRSNAALIIAPLGRDGAPFTGDKGEIISCDTGNTSVFCDPRPDNLLARQTQLQQTLRFDGHIGYGLTSNFSVQLDSGYYKGDVTNFDVFTTKIVPFSSNTQTDPCAKPGGPQTFGQGVPCALTSTKTRNLSHPIKAGQVTEIPLMLNGIVRFRKDSNFNPYVGVGAGYLITSLNQSAAVAQLNSRLDRLHVIQVTDEFGATFGKALSPLDLDGNVPFTFPASAKVDQGFQWQVVGGGEYFFNDRLSLVFDARYVISSQEVSILMNGQDQINVRAYTEDMFRKDGSLKIFLDQPIAPNPIDPNNSPTRFVCSLSNQVANLAPPKDYDNNGKPDMCFGGPGFRTPSETVVVQGGKIKLSNFNFGFGIRFHF